MIKFLSVFLGLCGFCFCAQAQKYITKTAHINFISHTDIIDIEGNNYQAAGIIDVKTGEIVFSVTLKAFKFELDLAEEHFNENYVESDIYPKSKFIGKIIDHDKLNVASSEEQIHRIQGELFLHGESKEIEVSVNIRFESNEIFATSEIQLKLSDFKIDVPKIVDDKVAKVIPVKISAHFKEYKK